MITIRMDVDCVLADIMTPWLAWYNRLTYSNLTVDKLTDWDIDQFVKPDFQGQMRNWLYDPTIYRQVPMIHGAWEAVKLLRTFGRVVYVTAEVPGQCGRKLEWLHRLNFPANTRDYVEMEDKSLFRADVAIDDGKHNFHEDPSRGLRILFNQPWNQGNDSTYDFRLAGWDLERLKWILEN